MAAYYNEIDPYAAQWLRNLIAAGHIAPGDVDERSIVDVRPDDLRGYEQCHFFAGIGGWSLALRMAGWDDARPVWTGSCPCQPFSAAGKRTRQQDERHLWPHWARLIRERRPPVLFGEQVATAVTAGWWDDAANELEAEGYAVASAILPACSVGAPHKRDRLWFVGYAEHDGSPAAAFTRRFASPSDDQPKGAHTAGELTRTGLPRDSSIVANAGCEGLYERRQPDDAEGKGGVSGRMVGNGLQEGLFSQAETMAYTDQPRPQGHRGLQECAGQFTARTSSEAIHPGWEPEPPLGRVANGIPARVGKLRALGNAIVPQVAAEFIKATM
jgi:DNA (cytosine-5)-methyltransferase 1